MDSGPRVSHESLDVHQRSSPRARWTDHRVPPQWNCRDRRSDRWSFTEFMDCSKPSGPACSISSNRAPLERINLQDRVSRVFSDYLESTLQLAADDGQPVSCELIARERIDARHEIFLLQRPILRERPADRRKILLCGHTAL